MSTGKEDREVSVVVRVFRLCAEVWIIWQIAKTLNSDETGSIAGWVWDIAALEDVRRTASEIEISEKKRKAPVYLRVSSLGQDAAESLKMQEAECIKFARSLGYEVDAGCVYREIGSGASVARAQFARLRGRAAAGGLGGLFVWYGSRLSRNRADFVALMEEFKACGVEVHFVRDRLVRKNELKERRAMEKSDGSRRRLGKKGSESWFGSEGETEAILGLVKAMDALLKATHREETRLGKEAVASRGLMPVGVGPGIYGYDYNRALRCRVVNEAEAEVVLRIFREYDEGRSCNAIARDLNAEGIPSKRGGKWGVGVLRNILRNPSYVGLDYYGKTRTEWRCNGFAVKVWVPREMWIEIRGFTPALVDPDLFARVQERLRRVPYGYRRGSL